jgi:hypothetical protein
MTFRNGKEEKLVFRCFEDKIGFIGVLPNSEESKPFPLAGKTPYRLRLERKGGAYRFAVNSRTLLTHEADDNREFEVCELSLSPYVAIGNVRIGPLNEKTADKPVVDKPAPATKKPGAR